MSIIVKVFCYLILQVTTLLSILFLLRGHNNPGGGFIGALIACTGIGFHILAYKKPPKFVDGKGVQLINTGVIFLLLSLFIPIMYGKEMLSGMWLKLQLFNQSLKLGTPLLFDIGIYLSIMGSLIWIMSYLESQAYD